MDEYEYEEEQYNHEVVQCVDERWLTEWFEFGYADLLAYLKKYQEFENWCYKHERVSNG